MVLVQKWQFFELFFLGNIGQGNVFSYILERKYNFLLYKNRKLKKSKNGHYSKGVSPRFWSKSGNFSNCFLLGNIGQGNVLRYILKRKNNFPGYKKGKLKMSKNGHFSKVFSPWFWSKIRHYSNCFFFFSQYGPGKCFSLYSRTKKQLSRL